MVDNSGSTTRSTTSSLDPEIFVQINRILTKFCLMKIRGCGNYMTHRVVRKNCELSVQLSSAVAMTASLKTTQR